MTYRASIDTQFGLLTVVTENDAITALHWGATATFDDTPLLREALSQLAAYNEGALTEFDLPLVPAGSDALQVVLAEISAIPHGNTATYGDIAKATGLSSQSVGQLCGANPIPIIIPCHRVMGRKGLTGFSGKGGVETKVALLRHEHAGGFLI
ncbi:MAG: methylated-DNA--[protein]-cysteine S-methyltransferase [Dinoroseobacter sp.]|nr:methylated-DNA--[protein]-cysteine S-methyltransferase [Dinoroseobacter sp.]